jgi:SAM-dependent methyltransferase
MNKAERTPDYGNWVSKKLIYGPGLLALIFLILVIVSRLFFIIAIPLLVITVYFSYSYYHFSPKGSNIQNKIREFLLERLGWNGKGNALDIGCGNGALAISLAKKYPEARITGIDYWGRQWSYSKQACEKNAEIVGVLSRTSFQKANAAALPFQDNSFNAVVSNFAFHEVHGVRDKKELFQEALRVLQPGGVFAFQDLFTYRNMFGDINDLLKAIRDWGIHDVQFIDTSNAAFVPVALRLPFMIGEIGIIYGQK